MIKTIENKAIAVHPGIMPYWPMSVDLMKDGLAKSGMAVPHDATREETIAAWNRMVEAREAELTELINRSVLTGTRGT